MMNKLLNLLNIHPDKNQKILLFSLAISGLLITYINPTLIKTLFSELPTQFIAAQSLVCSISGVLIGMIWQKKIREKAMKYFALLAIAESSCGCLLGFSFLF